MKHSLTFVIIPVILLVQIGLCQNPTLRYKAEATLRSAVIPGWGQIYNGQEKKGLYFLGAQALVLSSRYISDNIYNSKSDKYSNSRDPEELPDLWDQVERWKRIRDVARLGIVAIWSASVVDAYFNAKASSLSTRFMIQGADTHARPTIMLIYTFNRRPSK